MIYQLPTRSPRRYRGKYPRRVNMWSYSQSPSQDVVARHLEMRRPIHFELNDGTRFIADYPTLKADSMKLGTELCDLWNPDVAVKIPTLLSQERYDAMIEDVRRVREENAR